MECGIRVYESNVSTKEGTRPAGTSASVSSFKSSGKYTTLAVNVPYGVPFSLDVKPQSYNNESSRDFTTSKITFNYVEITLHHITSLIGSVSMDQNPLFASVETAKEGDSMKLRLYLKKTGGFYGYTATLNGSNQLLFKFLNPHSASGNSLSGIKICVDAGHGGSDGGAAAKDNKGNTIKESERCLVLAKKLQARLENMGATVVMTRTGDTSMEQSERISKVRASEADLGISIHRNASDSATPSGFISYHFNIWTKRASDLVYSSVSGSNLYTATKWSGVKWHYFYLSRISSMPFVLTENGFMSNASELQQITNDSFNDKCADSLAAGILNYFKEQ